MGTVGDKELLVQEKTSYREFRKHGFRVNMYRSSGVARNPYSSSDFHLLWVYWPLDHPDRGRFVTVIPMPLLVQHGVVSDELCSGCKFGKKNISIYPCGSDRPRPKFGWTSE